MTNNRVDLSKQQATGTPVDSQVSAVEEDWSREAVPNWNCGGRQLLKTIRRYQHYKAKRGPFAALFAKVYVLRHFFWSVVTGAEIPINGKIGGGLLIPHPNGIVIHPLVSIGPNCLIFQQVTLGATKDGTPTLGGHVDIGCGAKNTRACDHW